jgi:hypothetical protein
MKKRTPDDQPEETASLENKLFRLSPGAIQAFEILKAKQGPRSGPRLIGEAIDLLLMKYGEKPVGSPSRPTKTPARGKGTTSKL